MAAENVSLRHTEREDSRSENYQLQGFREAPGGSEEKGQRQLLRSRTTWMLVLSPTDSWSRERVSAFWVRGPRILFSFERRARRAVPSFLGWWGVEGGSGAGGLFIVQIPPHQPPESESLGMKAGSLCF